MMSGYILSILQKLKRSRTQVVQRRRPARRRTVLHLEWLEPRLAPDSAAANAALYLEGNTIPSDPASPSGQLNYGYGPNGKPLVNTQGAVPFLTTLYQQPGNNGLVSNPLANDNQPFIP